MLAACHCNKRLKVMTSMVSAGAFMQTQETVFPDLFELRIASTLAHREFMPRVHDVNMPCRWLQQCRNGKCPAFTVISGNYYCARKDHR